jgi:hypothetical protein
MKKQFEEIRSLVRKDEIERALEKAQVVVSPEFSNSLDLISNRYQKWKRDKRRGIGDDSVGRNSVVNDLLEILTEDEKNTTALTSNPHGEKNSINENTINQENVMEDKRTQVFISYSHLDKKYLQELTRQFKPLIDRINFWDDTKIEAGQKWNTEIKSQIEKAKIAILLISADFFNSDFIAKNELPPLLKLAEDGGAKILSVILKPCLWEEYPQINQYQAINNPKKPISSLDKNSRELVWVELARNVKKMMSVNE